WSSAPPVSEYKPLRQWLTHTQANTIALCARAIHVDLLCQLDEQVPHVWMIVANALLYSAEELMRRAINRAIIGNASALLALHIDVAELFHRPSPTTP